MTQNTVPLGTPQVSSTRAMFGNFAGWAVSALILGFTGACLLWLELKAGQVTMTTGFLADQRNLDVIELPISPTTIVPMNQNMDAGELYREAINEYRANRSAYDVYKMPATAPNPVGKSLPAIEKLLQATHATRASIFERTPEVIVNYDLERPPLNDLESLGNVCLDIALLTYQEHPDFAIKHAEAVFGLGHKLFLERLRFWEYFSGTGLMGGADAMLMRIYQIRGDTARYQAIKAFDDQRRVFHEKRIDNVRKVMWDISDAYIAREAGNVFFIAEHSKERMWRIEATLRIGLYKYNANSAGDQRAAKDRPAHWAQDMRLDPAVRHAAVLADKLTLDGYHHLN